MRRIKFKPVTIQVHPNLYSKMEDIRKEFKKNNICLSQVEITNMISQKVRIPKIDLIGGRNVQRKKRQPW